jgi:calcineurin-like phosphoesterase family protein
MNNKEKEPTIFFTSDTHFGHNNIIEGKSNWGFRKFIDTDHMDTVLIANWNSVVRPQDTVYVIGDFTMGRNAKKYLDRLLGKKILISGNHDKSPTLEAGWSEIFDYKEINVEGQHIVLCHFSFKVWNRSHHGSMNLYGHSHGTLPDDPNSLSIDVGVDCHNYFPISFEQVKAIMSKKTFKPIDHHKERVDYDNL